MIDKPDEYQIMYQVETSLWWYKILHAKALRTIERHFSSKQVRILDVGCGTGGMLSFLRANGYKSLSGVDLSPDAVRLTESRGFAVQTLDLHQIATFDPQARFDVIICNDVLCYFDNAQIAHILSEFRKRINPNGLIISNNNAFDAFTGVHSIVLNIPRRFVIKEFEVIFEELEMQMVAHTYWSFFLSPLIWAYRKIQLAALRLGVIKLQNLGSDVGYPGNFQNNLFLNIVKFEEKCFKTAPFGSSLFWVVKV